MSQKFTKVLDIHTLFSNDNRPNLLFLDISIVEEFIQWYTFQFSYNLDVEIMASFELKIYLIRKHLNNATGGNSNHEIRKSLKTINIIESKDVNISSRDELFLNEIQQMYFNNNASSRICSEILLCARKEFLHTKNIGVISNNPGFDFIPSVQRYSLPSVSDLAEVNAYLYLLSTLNLHKKVIEIAFPYIEQGRNAIALQEVIQEFIGNVKDILIQGSYDSIANQVNDLAMIGQAFTCVNEKDKTKYQEPKIKINHNASQSERMEQESIYYLALSITKIRNQLAHQASHTIAVSERFGDARTVIKYLCLLSLLFEKLDQRVGPW